MHQIIDFGPRANIWTRENRVSSDGEVHEVLLPGLEENALEAISALAKIDGKTRLNGNFFYPAFEANSKVTTDGFDQIQLFHNLHTLQVKLIFLGFDIPKIMGGNHGGKTHPIAAHANATQSLNAWYSRQSDDLTFGTNYNKWHLASDNDVSAHEAAHLLLDHMNPSLIGWKQSEGGAIHEGFSDAMAAALANDAEMSEDFPPNLGRPDNKQDGLRNCNNNLTLADVGSEVHDRGQVYAGFFWSIKKALEDPNGPFKLSSQEAADLMTRIALNHGANYTTSSPTPKDFVAAVLAGLDGLSSRIRKVSADRQQLTDMIIDEAIKRKMIMPPDKISKPEVEFRDIASARNYYIGKGINTDFYLVHKTAFAGGTTETYRQVIFSKKFGPMEVVDKGIRVIKNDSGKTISLTTKDVSEITSGGVDESGNITPKAAIQNAKEMAEKELMISRTKFSKFRFTGGKKESFESYRAAEMDMIIAESDLRNLSAISKSSGFGKISEHKIVMLEGSNVPHYEFKVGMSIYYVDTKTGEVKKRRDIIAN